MSKSVLLLVLRAAGVSGNKKHRNIAVIATVTARSFRNSHSGPAVILCSIKAMGGRLMQVKNHFFEAKTVGHQIKCEKPVAVGLSK
ncbi:hypothetical protein ATY27_13525 [Rheinheimera sp. F8]|nr:hypothetical protein ATY27_13525 [Rheinheimera sp. F8]